MYFLDFDGVLFDTKALKEAMERLGVPESERSGTTFDLLHSLDSAFDAQLFLFEDAERFLKEHGSRSFVVSSYLSVDPAKNVEPEEQRAYQKAKIERAGVAALVGEDHVHVVGESKEEALESLVQTARKAGETYVFIDDHAGHIIRAHNAGIPVLWMRRISYAQSPDADVPSAIPRITSFDEVERFL